MLVSIAIWCDFCLKFVALCEPVIFVRDVNKACAAHLWSTEMRQKLIRIFSLFWIGWNIGSAQWLFASLKIQFWYDCITNTANDFGIPFEYSISSIERTTKYMQRTEYSIFDCCISVMCECAVLQIQWASKYHGIPIFLRIHTAKANTAFAL